MSLKYTMEEVISGWRRTARIASFASARLSFQKDIINVAAVFSQRNIAKEESGRYQIQYAIQRKNLAVLTQSAPVEVSTEKLKAYGSLTNLIVVLRELPDTKGNEKNKTRQIIEIWKNGFLYSSLDVGILEKHGKVYTDGTFGCFELSPDEKHLVYVAEKKECKKQSFLQFGVASTPEGAKVGAEYEFSEDWGEQLVGKSQPVICILKVDWEPFNKEEPVQVVESNDEWSPGQIIWYNNATLAGVAWSHFPRRLGKIFCTNRPSRIFKFDIGSGQFEWYGSEKETAASPRLSRTSVVYLKSAAYGPHHKEQKIVSIDDSGSIRVVNPPTGSTYYGMYGDSFPNRCWSPDAKSLIFSTPCKSSVQSYALRLDSNEIQQLSLPDGCTGSIILDVLEDVVLAVGVCLTRPDQLYIGRVNWADVKSHIDWKRLSSFNELPSEHTLSSDLFTLQTSDGMEFEAMLIFRKGAANGTPLIVAPHGGPHVVVTDQFKLEAYFFCQLGFAVLMPNYRGSTGFGDKALNTLPGKAGVQDVQEVHLSTLKALENHAFLDKDKVFLFGGSHGGFLVTHLSGQYPDFYKAVSTRNPVIDIATMYPITDIPDWTIVETGLGDGSELEKILNPTTLSIMYECSPIKYVAQVKAPTLLLVGKVDRRVPPTQSIEYYRLLKLHGVKTKMLLYEDCHSLSQLPFDTDALINTALWFQESVMQV